jgi:hypothetical protein
MPLSRYQKKAPCTFKSRRQLKRRVRRPLPRPISREDNINFAIPLKVLKSGSFTGIAVGHRLCKLGSFKPTFSVSTPVKESARKLLHPLKALCVPCE